MAAIGVPALLLVVGLAAGAGPPAVFIAAFDAPGNAAVCAWLEACRAGAGAAAWAEGFCSTLDAGTGDAADTDVDVAAGAGAGAGDGVGAAAAAAALCWDCVPSVVAAWPGRTNWPVGNGLPAASSFPGAAAAAGTAGEDDDDSVGADDDVASGRDVAPLEVPCTPEPALLESDDKDPDFCSGAAAGVEIVCGVPAEEVVPAAIPAGFPVGGSTNAVAGFVEDCGG